MTENLYNFNVFERYQLLAQASYTKAHSIEHTQNITELKKMIDGEFSHCIENLY